MSDQTTDNQIIIQAVKMLTCLCAIVLNNLDAEAVANQLKGAE